MEGADIAPGNNATLQMLQDPRKRPPRTRLGDEIPRAIMERGTRLGGEKVSRKPQDFSSRGGSGTIWDERGPFATSA